jgi:hypothetical protein
VSKGCCECGYKEKPYLKHPPRCTLCWLRMSLKKLNVSYQSRQIHMVNGMIRDEEEKRSDTGKQDDLYDGRRTGA